MNIAITFRHMDGSDAIKAYANDKVGKLQKYLRQAMTAQVTISVDGLDHIADVRLQSGGHSYHGTETNHDMYASLDLVVDKLERQIHAEKGASVARRHGAKSTREFAQEVERESQRGTRG